MPGGIAGTGPFVVWSEAAAAASAPASLAAVVAPLRHAMALNLDASTAQPPPPGRVRFGLTGNVTAVPAGFTATVGAFFGPGINGAVAAFGRAARAASGKGSAASARRADVSLQYLGYSTDNGAYYYYNTAPGLNYQETLAAVRRDADALGLPFR